MNIRVPSKNTWTMIQEAMNMIQEWHGQQIDKSGEPYLEHLYRVAHEARNVSRKHDAYIVGLLHDIVEDTDVDLNDIVDNFTHEIVEAVDAMTHRPNEPYVDYLVRVSHNELAIIVKKADLLDNMNPRRCVRIKDERDFKRTAEVLLPRYAHAYRSLARLTGEFTQ